MNPHIKIATILWGSMLIITALAGLGISLVWNFFPIPKVEWYAVWLVLLIIVGWPAAFYATVAEMEERARDEKINQILKEAGISLER